MARVLAAELLEAEVESGRLGAASLLIARRGRLLVHEGFGRLHGGPGAPSVRPNSVYILGSIAKPVTVAALLLLAERGRLGTDDPVSAHLPEFTGGERGRVRVRDLLSHTSGLPDMLPENIELRRRHAPMEDFVAGALRTPLLFSPRTEFRYQSAGTLLAGAIAERLSGRPMTEFVREEIFEPLGMRDSSFGLSGRAIGDTVQSAPAPGLDAAEDASFGPNSAYWRNLAACWGCMHSTASDLAILLETFLGEGARAGQRVFSPATVRAMTTDQNGALNSPWGLGWALAGSKAWNVFGSGISRWTFGHTGAPGTLVWADPAAEGICVILTNRHYVADDGKLLRDVSNAAAAAMDAFP